jgi:hypothetical protein
VTGARSPKAEVVASAAAMVAGFLQLEWSFLVALRTVQSSQAAMIVV